MWRLAGVQQAHRPATIRQAEAALFVQPCCALHSSNWQAFIAKAAALPLGMPTPSSSPALPVAQSLAAEAAAASAAVAASAAAATGGKEPAGLSPTRCLLVLCANLGAVRSRLLPQQFGRWASLLQAGGGGKELQAAAQACAAELEAVETRLASAYIDRKQVGRRQHCFLLRWSYADDALVARMRSVMAKCHCMVSQAGGPYASRFSSHTDSRWSRVQAVLDEVMEQLLFTDGTLWEAAPPPTGLRPVALDLVHTLVAVQARQPAACLWLLHPTACSHVVVMLCFACHIALSERFCCPWNRLRYLVHATLSCTAHQLLRRPSWRPQHRHCWVRPWRSCCWARWTAGRRQAGRQEGVLGESQTCH